jgi:hypothetical protein
MLVLHWLCALVILAEALNKLDRTAPLRPGLAPRDRATEWLKAAAWLLLALGAGGGLAGPLLHQAPPTLPDVCIAVGFAVLIVRTRVKEG